MIIKKIFLFPLYLLLFPIGILYNFHLGKKWFLKMNEYKFYLSLLIWILIIYLLGKDLYV